MLKQQVKQVNTSSSCIPPFARIPQESAKTQGYCSAKGKLLKIKVYKTKEIKILKVIGL
jgi:hypothetical protein